MARIKIENLGGAVDSRIKKAKITAIYRGDDTADIELLENQKKYEKVPIFYHCRPDAKKRENGALEEGSLAFEVGDIVYVKFRREGEKLQKPIIIAGEKLKACVCYNLMFLYKDENGEVKAAICDVEKEKLIAGLDVKGLMQMGFTGDWENLLTAFDEQWSEMVNVDFHAAYYSSSDNRYNISIFTINVDRKAFWRRRWWSLFYLFVYLPEKKELKLLEYDSSYYKQFELYAAPSFDLRKIFIYKRYCPDWMDRNDRIYEVYGYYLYDTESGKFQQGTRYQRYIWEQDYTFPFGKLTKNYNCYTGFIDRQGFRYSFNSCLGDAPYAKDWKQIAFIKDLNEGFSADDYGQSISGQFAEFQYLSYDLNQVKEKEIINIHQTSTPPSDSVITQKLNELNLIGNKCGQIKSFQVFPVGNKEFLLGNGAVAAGRVILHREAGQYDEIFDEVENFRFCSWNATNQVFLHCIGDTDFVANCPDEVEYASFESIECFILTGNETFSEGEVLEVEFLEGDNFELTCKACNHEALVYIENDRYNSISRRYWAGTLESHPFIKGFDEYSEINPRSMQCFSDINGKHVYFEKVKFPSGETIYRVKDKEGNWKDISNIVNSLPSEPLAVLVLRV